MTLSTEQSRKLREELEWLERHPEFWHKPPTIREFIQPPYVNIHHKLYAPIKQIFIDVFGEELPEDLHYFSNYTNLLLTGAIGIGKTTISALICNYAAARLSCLRDPQAYYGTDATIAIMEMSVSADNARYVIFSHINRMAKSSTWMAENMPHDKTIKKRLVFPKSIEIIPGDSQETSFVGYDIFTSILDEADDHVCTRTIDYADVGYRAMSERVESRFGQYGLNVVIGSHKKPNGFITKMEEEFSQRDDSYIKRLNKWEAWGEESWSNKFFFFDTTRIRLATEKDFTNNPESVIKIPFKISRKIPGEGEKEINLRTTFLLNPEIAMRDSAGIPPRVGSTFINRVETIDLAFERYMLNHGYESPVDVDGNIESGFVGQNSIPRHIHIDYGTGGKNDSAAISMGHVSGNINHAGQLRPYITVDFVYRFSEFDVQLDTVIAMVLELKTRKFNIRKVTYDHFESTYFRQRLSRVGIRCDELSVDKNLNPYYDLRDALYMNAIEFPNLRVYSEIRGKYDLVEIVKRELCALVLTKDMVDHPPDGSKDCTDTIAGVVNTLMSKSNVNIIQGDMKNVIRMDGRRESYGFR